MQYYSNRKKALKPLWKLLRANDAQKEEPITINDQPQSEQEIFSEDIEVATVQPQVQRTGTIKQNVEQPDLFRSKNQSTFTFGSEASADSKMKIAGSSFSSPEILVFTTNHNVYKVQNRGLTNQSQILSKIEFEAEERPIYRMGTQTIRVI